jgi:hypothetical protein
MTSRKTTFLALMLFTLAPAAHADVLPEDSCTAVGQSCSTAPPDFHQPGVCRDRTCTKTLPEADGALQQMQYSCPRCVANGGQGGAGGTGGGTSAGGARDAGKADGAPDAGDPAVHGSMNCNCVITPANTANTTAALMFVAGLLAVFKGRRSRRG